MEVYVDFIYKFSITNTLNYIAILIYCYIKLKIN